MSRGLDALEDGRLDLLVVGGGIYGAWIAYDAALRGLRVGLVEQDDWGAGTSSASSKLIHGGLRYLEHLELGLVRTSLDERRRLFDIAPHVIHPLRFAIPIFRGGRLGRFRLKLGLTLYDLLAGRDQPVPPHRSLSAGELSEAYPWLRDDGLSGGFYYGDCGTDDARLTLEVVDGAAQRGAIVASGVRATGTIVDGGRVLGATLRDEASGRTAEVRATITMLAAGAWAAPLAPGAAARAKTRMTKGVHLVLPALPTSDAFLLTARRDGRVFFMIPWYGRTLVGTTDTDFLGDPGELAVTDDDVEYLLTEVNRVFRGAGWSRDDIVGAYAGVRVLKGSRSSPSDASREWTLFRAMPGLLWPVGGKYTSARADAERAVDRVFRLLKRRSPGRPTGSRPTPWAPDAPFSAWLADATDAGVALGLDRATAATAARRYGNRLPLLHERLKRSRQSCERIDPDLPFCMAEPGHCLEHEFAASAVDVLRRRIPLTLLAGARAESIRRAVRALGLEAGWTDAETSDRLAEVFRSIQWAALRPAGAGA